MPGALYRTAQFRAALKARRGAPDEGQDGRARAVLPPALFDLFAQMPPEDRRHGLAILAALEAAGADRSRDVSLLQAALLHDVGKAGAGVGLMHRVARVLLMRLGPAIWRRLADSPTGWRRPFWVLANHPARGAVWVGTQGGSEELVALIRYHEVPAPADWAGGSLDGAGGSLADWHARLQTADSMS